MSIWIYTLSKHFNLFSQTSPPPLVSVRLTQCRAKGGNTYLPYGFKQNEVECKRGRCTPGTEEPLSLKDSERTSCLCRQRGRSQKNWHAHKIQIKDWQVMLRKSPLQVEEDTCFLDCTLAACYTVKHDSQRQYWWYSSDVSKRQVRGRTRTLRWASSDSGAGCTSYLPKIYFFIHKSEWKWGRPDMEAQALLWRIITT